KDLEQAVKEGKFREDLYYRLSVVSIHLPRLCDRKEDIPLLINYFLNKYSTLNNRPVPTISPAALRMLIDYSWPGNVRELEHVIERAVTLSNSPMIMPEDLPEKIQQPQSFTNIPFQLPNIGLTLDEVTKQYLVKTLQSTDWNLTKTAQLLGISLRTVQRMIRRYQLIKNPNIKYRTP
ncbi:MAG: helix-turn-helix domain-containing protein, partial [candidate division WOR-3 bacterium]|nr:helix-turn-helix domain-containing protein [candidate division WOR-3 bacterium]